MRKKSAKRGKNTLAAEVTNVSPNGFWVLLGKEELFLPFNKFPWFRDATVAQIGKVETQSPTHLYWPLLDIDLAVDSIRRPQDFPLVSK